MEQNWLPWLTRVASGPRAILELLGLNALALVIVIGELWLPMPTGQLSWHLGITATYLSHTIQGVLGLLAAFLQTMGGGEQLHLMRMDREYMRSNGVAGCGSQEIQEQLGPRISNSKIIHIIRFQSIVTGQRSLSAVFPMGVGGNPQKQN